MKEHKLKITADVIDCGGGTRRYNFIVNPIVADSPVFRTMMYCLEEDRDKNHKEHNRGSLAKILRERHRLTWERYHNWADNT